RRSPTHNGPEIPRREPCWRSVAISPPPPMCDPIEGLRAEHRVHRLALRVLGAIARHAASGLPVPVVAGTLVLRYLRDVALGAHPAKEAATVLCGVAAHGAEAEVEAAGRIVRALDDAQQRLQELLWFWPGSAPLCTAAREGLVACTRALTCRLEGCMRLEETSLFPAARRVPADDRLDWPELV